MPSDPAPQSFAWLDLVPDPCAAVDADGRVIAANGALNALAGVDLRRAPLASLLADPHPPELSAATWRSTATRADGVPLCVELSHREVAGATRIVSCRPVRASGVPDDSTAALLHEAFVRAPIGMAFFDTGGFYVRVNDAMCALMGRAEHELLGRRDQEFTHPDDRQSDVDAAWRILRGELDAWQTEKRFVRPDGSSVWTIANLTFLRDAGGNPLAWLGQFQDITARRALEQRLRTLADEDPLTGLPNRRRLEQDLQRALSAAARHGRKGALLVLDLDGFKAINDEHGHARGDAVLVAVADRLRHRVRDTDLLARLGGDEFAVLLTDTCREGAERVASDLRAAVAACEPEAALGVSIGIAVYAPGAIDTPRGLLDRADREMYRAKTALRGR